VKFNYIKNKVTHNKKSFDLDEVNKYLIKEHYHLVKPCLISVKKTSKGLEPLIDWKHLHSTPEIKLVILNYIYAKS